MAGEAAAVVVPLLLQPSGHRRHRVERRRHFGIGARQERAGRLRVVGIAGEEEAVLARGYRHELVQQARVVADVEERAAHLLGKTAGYAPQVVSAEQVRRPPRERGGAGVGWHAYQRYREALRQAEG